MTGFGIVDGPSETPSGGGGCGVSGARKSKEANAEEHRGKAYHKYRSTTSATAPNGFKGISWRASWQASNGEKVERKTQAKRGKRKKIEERREPPRKRGGGESMLAMLDKERPDDDDECKSRCGVARSRGRKEKKSEPLGHCERKREDEESCTGGCLTSLEPAQRSESKAVKGRASLSCAGAWVRKLRKGAKREHQNFSSSHVAFPCLSLDHFRHYLVCGSFFYPSPSVSLERTGRYSLLS